MTTISGLEIGQILQAVPIHYELWAALFIIACKLVSVFVPPPRPASRFVALYRIIVVLGLNIGWAANALTTETRDEAHDTAR